MRPDRQDLTHGTDEPMMRQGWSCKPPRSKCAMTVRITSMMMMANGTPLTAVVAAARELLLRRRQVKAVSWRTTAATLISTIATPQ